MNLTPGLTFPMLVVSIVYATRPTPSSYSQECQTWENVTRTLNQESLVSMTCNKNGPCTGFDCSGLFEHTGYYAQGGIQIDYCFGMAIHPCKNPVDLHFYLDVPSRHSHFQHNISNSTSFKIPKLHYSLGDMGDADGFVTVHMVRTSRGGHPYVMIGMTFKVRVQGPAAMLGTWPEQLQRTLMPDTYIPVPPCDKHIPVARHDPNTCHPQRKQVSTTPATSSGKTMSPGASTFPPEGLSSSASTTRAVKGKGCKVDTFESCPSHEMCVTAGLMIETCVCVLGYTRNAENKCTQTEMTTKGPIIEPYPEKPILPKKKSGTPTNTIIITVICVAGLAILAIIAGVIFVFYRKHQQRYGNHQLLINNDDDEPIDVST